MSWQTKFIGKQGPLLASELSYMKELEEGTVIACGVYDGNPCLEDHARNRPYIVQVHNPKDGDLSWSIMIGAPGCGWGAYQLRDEGELVTDVETIKRIMPCDSQVLKFYKQ